MDFVDSVKEYAKRIISLKETLLTEEATKTALIMPFFSQLLGYDVFNPNEFIPEFSADFGAKKGERVDYAIKIDNVITILVEAKTCGENLEKHGTQLFHYYNSTPARFGILTNGIIYRFYTDLTKDNLMDDTPFLVFDFENYNEKDVAELKKFHIDNFSIEGIISTAAKLKYISLMEEVFDTFGKEPDDEFVRYILCKIYDGLKTQHIIEKFRPIIKTAYNDFIGEQMNERITTALKSDEGKVVPTASVEPKTEEKGKGDGEIEDGITTTPEELEAFYTIRTILSEITSRENITYKDTRAYFSINFQHNSWKWICRIQFRANDILLVLPDENKKGIPYHLDSLDDLMEYKDPLIVITKRYLEE